MNIDRLNIEKFTDNPEELHQDVILKYFELSGRTDGVLGIEHIPKIVEAGFVAICLKGECELMLDHVIYNFKAGQMCVGFTATVVRTLWKSKDLECVVLAANMEFLRNINIPSVSDLFVAIRANPCISLSDEDMIALPAYFRYIQSIYNRKEHTYRMEITKQLLMVLCYEVAAIYQKDLPYRKRMYSYKDSVFRNFVHLLSLKYQEERRVAYYAEELCITPKYLSHIVKEVSNKTAAEWIDDFVLRNIKIFLTTSALTIQQISDQFNFPNASFFTQYFKRATGKTPKAFRNEGSGK
jgi:AraC-like DNA-binding protein